MTEPPLRVPVAPGGSSGAGGRAGSARSSFSAPPRLSDLGIGAEDFAQIAADALEDEVLANAPRQPTAADIGAILAASGRGVVKPKG